jgi:transcriptional regulator with XRE-family HTH domain
MTMTFASEFTRLRKLKGFSQTQVAKILKVDTGYFSKVANGEGFVPTEDRIARIALILELSEKERDGLFFAAGKIPPEVIHAMRRDPSLFEIVRNAASHRRSKK